MPHFAAWFRREDYQRIRQIMDDSDKFPPEFDAWETRAKGQMEEAKRHGLVITPVILDPDEFLALEQRTWHRAVRLAQNLQFVAARPSALNKPRLPASIR